MEIKDILKLENKIENIQIIKTYLLQPISIFNYRVAILKILNISNNLFLYKQTITEANFYSNKFEEDDTDNYLQYLKFLYDAHYNLKDFENSIKILNIRKKLSIYEDKKSILYDEIVLKKEINEPFLDTLLQALNQETNPDIYKFYLKEAFLIYIENQDYDKALNYINIYNKKYLNDKQTIYLMYVLYKLGFDEEYFNISNSNLNNENIEIKTASLIFQYLYFFKDSQYRKLSVLEPKIDENLSYIKFISILIDYYKAAIDANSIQMIKKSVDFYQGELDKLLEKQEEDKKLLERKYNFINKISSDEYSVNLKKENDNKSYNLTITNNTISDYYNVLDYSLKLSTSLKFREYLRQLFIFVEQKYKVKDFILFYNNEFFNYKKERLYDKIVFDEFFHNSILLKTQTEKKDIVVEKKELENYTNLLTREVYNKQEYEKVYSYYLLNGAIFQVQLDTSSSDNYIFYKLLSSIIYQKLVYEAKIINLKQDNNFYQDILKSNLISNRILANDTCLYNQKAFEIFKLSNKSNILDFISNIENDSLKEYKNIIDFLLVNPNTIKEIEYIYKDKHIKEILFSTIKQDSVIIISSFIDLTDYYLRVNKLEYENKIHEGYKINKKRLLIDLYSDSNFIYSKYSLFLIDFELENNLLYDLDKLNNYYLNHLIYLKQKFNEENLYYINDYQIIALVSVNDIRQINNIIEDFFKNIEKREDLKLNFKISIYKNDRLTCLTDFNLIFKSLNLTLLNLKKENREKWNIYKHQDYEKEVFEAQILSYVLESINNNTFELYFSQVNDFENKQVIYYRPYLNLIQYDMDFESIKKIAFLNDKIEEFYIILFKKVALFLNKIKTNFNISIKVIIDFPFDLLKNDKFIYSLYNIIEKNNILLESFVFLLNKVNNYNLRAFYINRLNDLIQKKFRFSTNNLELFNMANFEFLEVEFNNQIKPLNYISFLNSYTKSINSLLVVNNINNKEDLELAVSKKLNFFSGKVYKNIKDDDLFLKIKKTLQNL